MSDSWHIFQNVIMSSRVRKKNGRKVGAKSVSGDSLTRSLCVMWWKMNHRKTQEPSERRRE